MKIKVLSLFSGIGGLDIACEMAGMEIVGQVEIDSFCQKVLAKHWPHIKRMDDIKKIRGDEFGAIDIIVGGVPCQPASVAGKRRGTEDDRWLWGETLRIVKAIRPKWCVFENPFGILSLQGGVPFEGILSEMEAEGYETGTFIIPACAVGAPHKRQRVFIVGYSSSCGLPRESRRWAGQEFENGHSQHEERDVADSPCELFNRSGDAMPAGRGEFADGGGGGTTKRPAQPCLGDNFTRISNGLAGHRWPAGWWPTPDSSQRGSRAADLIVNGSTVCRRGSGQRRGIDLETAVRWPAGPGLQYDWEPPRIATGVKGRVQKLKALGNAVIPAQAYPTFKAIAEIEGVVFE